MYYGMDFDQNYFVFSRKYDRNLENNLTILLEIYLYIFPNNSNVSFDIFLSLLLR